MKVPESQYVPQNDTIHPFHNAIKREYMRYFEIQTANNVI